MAAPLGVLLRRGPRRTRRRRGLLASGLALGGSLALSYLVTAEGKRSAATPEDTWTLARLPRASRADRYILRTTCTCANNVRRDVPHGVTVGTVWYSSPVHHIAWPSGARSRV